MNIDEDKIIEWIKTNTGITDGLTTKNVSLAGLKNILVKYHESELNSLRLDFVMLSDFTKYCNEWGTYNKHGDNLWYEYSPLEAKHKETRTTEQMLIEFKKLHSA